jgi:beta-lactamase class D
MSRKFLCLAAQTVNKTMHIFRALAVFILFVFAACSPSVLQQTAIEEVNPQLGRYFEGFDGAFVLYDLKDNHYFRYNPRRCEERLLPASTFKIMTALIGLETGVIPEEDYVIPWDGTPYQIASWNQDHTLKTAFQNSVVWYYQEVARRIGQERMQQYIDAVGYGNQDITGNPDSFWLDGAIQISADEQVEFLKKLYQGDLPFSPRSIALVREIMLLEVDNTHRFSGKTGSGMMDNVYIGWFVGYEEVNGNVYFFATNLTSTDPETNGLKAKQILQEILKDQALKGASNEHK